MVRHLPLVLEVPLNNCQKCRINVRCSGPRFDPRSRGEKIIKISVSEFSFSSVIAGMTLDKCIVLRIRTLTGCPLCRESPPPVQVKEPYGNLDMVTCRLHPATVSTTRSVQSTPATNTHNRVWQYIEKEKKFSAY